MFHKDSHIQINYIVMWPISPKYLLSTGIPQILKSIKQILDTKHKVSRQSMKMENTIDQDSLVETCKIP